MWSVIVKRSDVRCARYSARTQVPSYIGVLFFVRKVCHDPGAAEEYLPLLQISLAFMGAGIGFCFNAITLFVTNAAPNNRMGNALGIIRMSQFLAGMIGQTAVAGVVSANSESARSYIAATEVTFFLALVFATFPIWLCGYMVGKRNADDGSVTQAPVDNGGPHGLAGMGTNAGTGRHGYGNGGAEGNAGSLTGGRRGSTTSPLHDARGGGLPATQDRDRIAIPTGTSTVVDGDSNEGVCDVTAKMEQERPQLDGGGTCGGDND